MVKKRTKRARTKSEALAAVNKLHKAHKKLHEAHKKLEVALGEVHKDLTMMRFPH
jgi:hypothetical protein